MNSRRVQLAENDNTKCPNCGEGQINARTFSDTVDFRGLELDVEGLQDSKCADCGHSWISDAQLLNNNSVTRSAYGVVRDKLRATYGLLSGEEIKNIRESLGLNQKIAASLFGGGSNAFNKYESGEVLQSFAMDRLLRLAKIIGAPIVSFLSDVDMPAPFVAYPASGSSSHITVKAPKLIGRVGFVAHEQKSMVTQFYGTPANNRYNFTRA